MTPLGEKEAQLLRQFTCRLLAGINGSSNFIASEKRQNLEHPVSNIYTASGSNHPLFHEGGEGTVFQMKHMQLQCHPVT